jgi:hypothetical protein
MYYGKWLRQITETIQRFADLPERLTRISENINNQTEAIRRAAESAEQNKQELLSVLAKLRVPESEKDEQRIQYRQNHTLQIWLTVGTWFAFIAAAVYAFLAGYQLRTMNKTLEELQQQTQATQQQAAAAQKQTNILEGEFEQNNAALVYADPFGLANFGEFSVNFRNIGHGAATNLNTTANISLRDFPSGKVIVSFGTFRKVITRVDPPADWHIESTANTNNVVGLMIYYPIGPAYATMLKEGTAAIAVDLSYSYNNGFKNISVDVGCFAYFKRSPPWTKRMPDGHILGSGNMEGTYPCDGLRKGMTDALEWESAHKNRPN